MEIKTYPLNRKQQKFLKEVGLLADRMNLPPAETWKALSHHVVNLNNLFEKGFEKFEKKGWIEKQ